MEYKGEKYNAKRFAYDVFCEILPKYDFPKTLLQVEIEENQYPNPKTDVPTVCGGVIAIALDSRDKWKRIFKSQQEISVLNDIQKFEDFLEKNAFLPKTTDIAPDNRLRRTLAFFSELILFLHSNSIEFDFENLLDIWSKYFHEKIAVNVDPNKFLHSLFFPDDFIQDYLSLVKNFIDYVAKPYGKTDGVSKLFRSFSEKLETFYPKKLNDKEELKLKGQEARDYIDKLLNNRNSYKILEESVSHLSGIFKIDFAMPGHSKSLEQPQHQRSSSLPSTSAEGIEDKLDEKNLDKEETNPESEDETPDDEKPQ